MSNYSDNAKAIDQFRNELRAMLDDICEIDKDVLNQAMNDGVIFAERRTPVGFYPNHVEFMVKRGPDAGKIVSFDVKGRVGGFLKKNWHKLPTKKSASGVEAELVNTAEYASYWNDGHRIVDRHGVTHGIQEGTYVLEKTGDYIEKRMIVLFARKVKEVQEKHD
ncbi:MAG: HK97 gp10 family phage protein [Lachnospiraceae bacterium]|nr:HK97 gp10 family phage protein [Lachnospiraceae bacterium]